MTIILKFNNQQNYLMTIILKFNNQQNYLMTIILKFNNQQNYFMTITLFIIQPSAFTTIALFGYTYIAYI